MRRGKMKTGLVVGIVVAVHCVALGSLMIISGCRTGHGSIASQSTPEAVKLPPVEEIQPVVVQPPAQPDLEKGAKSVAAKTTTYVVVAGDSLSAIAHKFHLSVSELQSLNNIKDPKKIRVGQKLVLPGELEPGAAPLPPKKQAAKPKAPAKKPVTTAAAPAKPAAAKPAPEKPAPEGTDSYVVKSGDRLATIASKYGTTVEAIRSANHLASSNIKIGQKLIIPAGSPKKEATPPAAQPAPAKKTAVTPAPAAAGTLAPSVPPKSEPVTTVTTPTADTTKVKDQAPKNAAAHQYTVQPGDDNWKTLAQKYNVSESELKQFNKLPADATLKPGQVINVP
jgi:peptidoglycan DL-endopeptidase LytF